MGKMVNVIINAEKYISSTYGVNYEILSINRTVDDPKEDRDICKIHFRFLQNNEWWYVTIKFNTETAHIIL